jgi:hypothetical protein
MKQINYDYLYPRFLHFWSQIKNSLRHLLKEPVFYVYLVAVVIYLPWFLPTLNEIVPWDETYFLASGKELLRGNWPVLGYGPLLSIVGGISYLPFQHSPLWLIHTDSLSRFLLFSSVFISTWQVAKAMREQFNPVVMFGFLFLSPILISNFEYPADLLFASISALAFSQAIKFLKTKALKHVWWTSFWLGLGMLTRGDALILLIAFTVFILIVGRHHEKWFKLLIAAIIPFFIISAGYVALRGAFTGDFDTAMAYRSYTAFEQGQEIDLPGDEPHVDAPIESYHVSRLLFGTPEENGYSVFKAISRNPAAYFRRLIKVIKALPGLFLTAYYRRFGILIAALALRGLAALIKQKKIELAVLHFIWMLSLVAGIARTLVRVGYFRLFFFAMLSLAAIGLIALLNNIKNSYEGWFWAAGMVIVVVLAFIIGDYSIQFSMLVFLCWLLLVFVLSRNADKLIHWQSMAMLLLLSAGFLLSGGFRIYTPRNLEQQPRESASIALRKFTEQGDFVLTCTSSVVFMAERQVANFCSSDIPEFEDSEEFITWMRAQEFNAIYLDSASSGTLIEMVLDQKGRALKQVFGTETGQSSIFLLETNQ